MPERKDVYANIIQIAPVESASNTLTFGNIDLGLTIFQKVGIVISRVVVDWTAQLLADFTGNADSMAVAITQSNSVGSISLAENSTIWKAEIRRGDYGAAASAEIKDVVRVYDLSSIPGGGEFLAPRPLYWGMQGNSLSAAFQISMRIYFQIIQLKPEEYFELLESRRFFG